MRASIKVTGVGALRKIFKDVRRKATDVSVLVGYTANYALAVHENVEANFKAPGTGAKFLERPLRQMHSKEEISKIVGKTLDKGGSMEQGLLVAGLRLQRESQKVCPIDTGNLRASAFTRKE